MWDILDCIIKCVLGRPRVQWSVDIDGTIVTGDILMVKFEFDQEATFTATPLDRRGKVVGIEPGSASWEFVGTDADGNDVSGDMVLTVDPANELSATLRSTSVELTGTLTLRADGDPDAGEYAPIVATESIIVDASNAVAFSLSASTPVDV